MKITFRTPTGLLSAIRTDLRRPHPFALERVGFLLAGAAMAPDGFELLARAYQNVADADYVFDTSVGARFGSGAIRAAMAAAYRSQSGIFHIHLHDHRGRPDFGEIDRRESNLFVPSFFNATPKLPQGAIVLSADRAHGQVWLRPTERPLHIDTFSEPGAPRWEGTL